MHAFYLRSVFTFKAPKHEILRIREVWEQDLRVPPEATVWIPKKISAAIAKCHIWTTCEVILNCCSFLYTQSLDATRCRKPQSLKILELARWIWCRQKMATSSVGHSLWNKSSFKLPSGSIMENVNINHGWRWLSFFNKDDVQVFHVWWIQMVYIIFSESSAVSAQFLVLSSWALFFLNLCHTSISHINLFSSSGPFVLFWLSIWKKG